MADARPKPHQSRLSFFKSQVRRVGHWPAPKIASTSYAQSTRVIAEQDALFSVTTPLTDQIEFGSKTYRTSISLP